MTRYYSTTDECSARNGTHRDRQEGRGEGSIRNVTGCPRGTPKHNFLALLRGSHDLPSRRDSDFVFLPRTPSCYHIDSSDCKWHLCFFMWSWTVWLRGAEKESGNLRSDGCGEGQERSRAGGRWGVEGNREAEAPLTMGRYRWEAEDRRESEKNVESWQVGRKLTDPPSPDPEPQNRGWGLAGCPEMPSNSRVSESQSFSFSTNHP